MKFRSLIAASAIAFSSFAAFAGTATFVDGAASFTNDAFSTTGQFTQTIAFDGLAVGTYQVTGSISGQQLTVDTLLLNENTWTWTNATFGNGVHYIKNGAIEVTDTSPFTLFIHGTNYATNAKYSGELYVTAVPEPESFAMLLAGLGLMGAIARRRIRVTS
jgi:hypothetical protein